MKVLGHTMRWQWALIVCVLLASGCAGSMSKAPSSSADVSVPTSAPVFGGGPLAVFPDSQTELWLRQHPSDRRTPALRGALGGRPTALWLAGSSGDLGNLRTYVAAARRTSSTPVIVLYNIPGRNDGISGPQHEVRSADYRRWVDSVAATLGRTRALVVVEPDALWLADRQFASDKAGFADRIADLRYAVSRMASTTGRSVYLDAGTSSGSVSAARMAQLLVMAAGTTPQVGFAVNVSSFAPTAAITAYANAIRGHLWESVKVSAHYVVDTSRNGNQSWDNTWCNPPGRKVGAQPGTITGEAPGLDVNLWVKAPGTSDGNCGTGPGTRGGDFMPGVAFGMIN